MDRIILILVLPNYCMCLPVLGKYCCKNDTNSCPMGDCIYLFIYLVCILQEAKLVMVPVLKYLDNSDVWAVTDNWMKILKLIWKCILRSWIEMCSVTDALKDALKLRRLTELMFYTWHVSDELIQTIKMMNWIAGGIIWYDVACDIFVYLFYVHSLNPWKAGEPTGYRVNQYIEKIKDIWQ